MVRLPRPTLSGQLNRNHQMSIPGATTTSKRSEHTLNMVGLLGSSSSSSDRPDGLCGKQHARSGFASSRTLSAAGGGSGRRPLYGYLWCVHSTGECLASQQQLQRDKHFARRPKGTLTAAAWLGFMQNNSLVFSPPSSLSPHSPGH